MDFTDYTPVQKTKRMRYDPTLIVTIRDVTLLWQWRPYHTALESFKTRFYKEIKISVLNLKIYVKQCKNQNE